MGCNRNVEIPGSGHVFGTEAGRNGLEGQLRKVDCERPVREPSSGAP